MADDIQEDDHLEHLRFRVDEEMDFFTELALHEAERWIQAVTRQKFQYPDDFRKSLSNGILLCELLNAIRPGSVKRINKLPSAIAGLDNINVFLKSCQKNFGLTTTQLFDSTDLEDLSQRAISDENEDLLKQEVDRRARNVAIAIFWLGRSVERTYKGPSIDVSAFTALVHQKSGIVDDVFKSEIWSPVESKVNTKNVTNRHIRDSSYDSLGSYERESETSFDELDNGSGTMPVRDMHRYGSASSLTRVGDQAKYSLANDSTYSDDKHDSLYQSSTDLSQGSHAHTRSSSTDSMDGSYHGNHSRQSSGSADNYTPNRQRVRTPSTSGVATDPLQFVKMKGADELAKMAEKQIEAAKEINKMREQVDSPNKDEPDWQSNFSNWKQRRTGRRASAAAFVRVGETEGLVAVDEPKEEPPKEEPKVKTFDQIKADKQKRKSLGNTMHFYPIDDDVDAIVAPKTESKTESRPKKKSTEEIATWAQDSSGEGNSQSDSEANNNHQSGDTDNVFTDKMPKVISKDKSWMKSQKTPESASKVNMPPRMEKQLSQRSNELWKNNANSASNSQKVERRKVDLPPRTNKINKITQAFEKKTQEAENSSPYTRREEFRNQRKSLDLGNLSLHSMSRFTSKSLDFTDSHSPKGFTVHNEKVKSPVLSPTSPNALLPKSLRATKSSPITNSTPSKSAKEKAFVEKVIKISQKPNNSRGFGFAIAGGMEKRQPVTVPKVSLGSAADVCEVQVNDEILAVNNRDVANLTLAQVQGIVEHSVKRGQIELKVRRNMDEGSFDSLDEDEQFHGKTPSLDNKSDSSSLSTDPTSEDTSYKSPQFLSRLEADDSGRPRIMDQLIAESKREANNNELKLRSKEKTPEKPPSPVIAETFKTEIAFSAQTAPKTDVAITLKQDSPLLKRVEKPESPVLRRAAKQESPKAAERKHVPNVHTVDADVEPVQMRKHTTPVKEAEAVKVRDSPPPPTPPASEPPAVHAMVTRTPLYETPQQGRSSNKSSDSEDGFGPPAALLRWQQRRPQSKYQAESEQKIEASKRLSCTLPYKSDVAKILADYSKDDTMMDKVSKDFESTVTVSKPLLSERANTYHFEDTSRLEEWSKKHEIDIKSSSESSESEDETRPITPPPKFDVSIQKVHNLTPQPEPKPEVTIGHLEMPSPLELNIPSKDEPPLSPQEKFERDQQRIRLQYEEEKKRAREEEERKNKEEGSLLKTEQESFLQKIESQVQQTKQEVAQNLDHVEPLRPAATQPPKYDSEPMTIRLNSNTPGRPLVIDPRNQEGHGETKIPEYSFHVDLQSRDKPPPRKINKETEPSQEEVLKRERQKIREEEERKFDEERKRWQEQQEKLRKQEESIKKEREKLQREQERIERERRELDYKKSTEDRLSPHYQSASHSPYHSSRSSSGSAGSLSPKSPPPALAPRRFETWAPTVPPPTAPKPDKSTKEKGRLTRDDLLAMNRKPTPLQSRPDNMDAGSQQDGEQITREAPTKVELHSLNAVPKPKFRTSAGWIKDPDEMDSSESTHERPFVIGKRSDVIHTDYSTPQDHWLVREAERRRLAEQSERDTHKYDTTSTVQTARAGPAKPSTSSLVNRFRGDIHTPKNRYSYPSSQTTEARLSSRPLSTGGSSLRQYERSQSPEAAPVQQQFSAKTQQNSYASSSMTQTLPANFSFKANQGSPRKFEQNSSLLKSSPSADEASEHVTAVSGKQKCSHCGEELGFGAAMVIESLGLYYHVQCFRCCVCRTPLGNGSEGADVRVRVNKLHCHNCYSNDEAGLKFSKV